MTLLEKAKNSKCAQRTPTNITKEHIDLAIAWTKDEVTFRQVLWALFENPNANTQGYVLVARALREAMRQGLLKPTTKSLVTK